MTRTQLSTVLLLTCSIICQAQEKTSDYYWYRGKQIEVTVNHNNLLVYYKNPSVTEGRFIHTYGIMPEGVAEQDYNYNKEIFYNIFSFDSNLYDSIYQGLLRDENVLSVQRCYGEDIPTPTGRHFYVNLKSAEDISLLEDIAEQTGTQVAKKLSFGNWYSIETNKESVGDALTCSNFYSETALFESVDPAFFMNIEPQSTVTDTDYNLQWNLNDNNFGINIEDAWDYTKGSPNVKIAVFDSGILKRHQEFDETNFCFSYDTYRHSYPTLAQFPYTGHGTEVASIIASNHNNYQIAGIAPRCRIMDISNPMEEIQSTDPRYRREVLPEDIADGFIQSMNNGADVINCSWGSNTNGNPFLSIHVENAIDSVINNGRNGLGCVVVFASGNENSMCNYPGNSNPDILVVGATQNNGSRCSFSNYGAELDLVAPGQSIYVATSNNYGDNQYVYSSGTSFAAPQVSATASMILSVAPQLSVKQITKLITNNAIKVGPLTYPLDSTHGGHWNNQYGFGLLDVYHSLVTDYSNDNCNGEMIEGCFVNVTNTTVTGSFEVTTHTRAEFSGNFYVEGDCLFVVSGQELIPE